MEPEMEKCHFCGGTLTTAEAQDRGWIPYFYDVDLTEITEAVCPGCLVDHHVYPDETSEYRIARYIPISESLSMDVAGSCVYIHVGRDELWGTWKREPTLHLLLDLKGVDHLDKGVDLEGALAAVREKLAEMARDDEELAACLADCAKKMAPKGWKGVAWRLRGTLQDGDYLSRPAAVEVRCVGPTGRMIRVTRVPRKAG